MENNLPKGWIECSIGEILISRKGKKPSSTINEPKEGYLPYILIDEMEGKPVRAYTNDQSVPLVKKNDVLLVWDGSIGKCGSGLEGVIGSTLVALTPQGNIPTKFLEYTIRNVNPFIKETSTGTGLQHINKDFFKECVIPLPPLPEQQRIVEKLDALMARMANSKTRLEKIPTLLKNFRQSVLAAAISGELTKEWREGNKEHETGTQLLLRIEKHRKVRKRTQNLNEDFIKLEVPDSWKITNIDNIADEVVDCPHSTPRWESSGKICLRTTNFLPNKLDLSEVRYVSDKTFQERTARLKPKYGDLLYSREGGILGIGCILNIKKEVCLGQRMMMFRVNSNVDNSYVCYFLNSPQILKHVNSLIGGSAAPHINVRDIKEYPLPLPPLEEQKEIVRKVEELFHFADSIEARYQKAKTWFDKLPQSLLAKAFRGELVPQDENDEPASELLKRIQQAKQNYKPSSKAKKRKMYEDNDQLSLVAEE